MVVQFTDGVAGTAVYINPDYVVTLRPDSADPERLSVVTVRNGESIRVRGDHREVASKLGHGSA